MTATPPVIEIRDLTVDYYQQGKWTTVVEGLRLQVDPGEVFGLVGESGCGKSTTANALMGYSPPACRFRQGSVHLDGMNILKAKRTELERVRGRMISLVPQNPTTALSPGMRVGRQIIEVLRFHHYCSGFEDARRRTLDLLRLVSLPDPEKVFDKYSHQLSGGQQQRVVIAMALACDPRVIVLDEPTTGLDVTTQAQILDLLADLRMRQRMAMFYVTHNLGVVAQICTRIGVMYAGQLVEVAVGHALFHDPGHPYTQGLIASVPSISRPSRTQTLLLRGLLRRSELPPGCHFAPRCEFAVPRCFEEPQMLASVGPNHLVACWRWGETPSFSARMGQERTAMAKKEVSSVRANPEPLVQVENLRAAYGYQRSKWSVRRYPKVVVDEVSFRVWPGETYALVGESGSGKTTVARAISGLLPYVSGEMTYGGIFDLSMPVGKRPSGLLRAVQLVFQNPDASLNPRHRVSRIIGRPLQKFFGLSGMELQRGVERLLEDVKLVTNYCSSYPDELSGGERQRVAVARALAAKPQLLLCDEILSSLDVSVQANVLKLLRDLQAEQGIAFLFISHDLAIVRSLASQVGVMYWGSLCEVGEVEEVFSPPSHPYTSLLLSSVPEADPDQVMPAIRKDIGLLVEASKTACPFAPRCPWVKEKTCDEVPPPWQSVSASHKLRCHLPVEELVARGSQKGRLGLEI